MPFAIATYVPACEIAMVCTLHSADGIPLALATYVPSYGLPYGTAIA